MFNSRPALVNNKQLQTYQQSQIMSMEPVPLLIKVYDFIILHCKKKEAVKASKGLVELMSALNFDYDEVALGLFRLYQYCQDKIKLGEYDEAIKILENLRNAWAESVKREKSAKSEEVPA
ncbi:flagellar export chaperone FliS [candidate division KSB1 bacterium]